MRKLMHLLYALIDTSRILLTISAKLCWKIKQYDNDMDFLHGTMERRLYTTQPQGFEQGNGLVFLLNMAALLVQSAYLWFGDLKHTLEDYALFSQSMRVLYFTAPLAAYSSLFLLMILRFSVQMMQQFLHRRGIYS